MTDGSHVFRTAAALIRSAEAFQKLTTPAVLANDLSAIANIARARIELIRSIEAKAARAEAICGAFESLQSLTAAQSMANTIAKLSSSAEAIASLDRQSKWLQNIRDAQFRLPAIESTLAGVLQKMEASQLLVSGISTDQIGAALPIGRQQQRQLVNSFSKLGEAHDRFYTGATGSTSTLLSIEPALVAGPATEYLNAADFINATTGQLADETTPGIQIVAGERQSTLDAASSLTEELARRFPDLSEALEGARIARAEKKADYVRHFLTSYRELLTQLLHRLAPDESVKAWTDDRKDFDKGRPTRAARVRFICRQIVQEKLRSFVDKDIPAVVELFSIFQAGTHSAASPFPERQLDAVQCRVEGAMLFLLQIDSAGVG
ncbi:MAG TPA: hypothetical protein VGN12_12115 [Pirellulales bacterium]|jgi:hypothetical protein